MLSILKNISPYNCLSDDELRLLTSHAKTRHFKKNTLIIQQGDETDSLYIVREGEMKIYVESDNGRELTVRIVSEGDTFGELALFGEFPRSANVMTLTDSSAIVINKSSFMECLRNNPEISLSLIKSLADMVRETTGELSHIALSDVYGRLIHVLQKYSFKQDGITSVQKFTHREIANMIGSSREMVSKILKDLEKGEYISVEDSQYIIQKKLPSQW